MNALIFLSAVLAVASGQLFYNYPHNYVFPNQFPGFQPAFHNFRSGQPVNYVTPTFTSNESPQKKLPSTPVVFQPNFPAGFQTVFPVASVAPNYRSSPADANEVAPAAFVAPIPVATPVAAFVARANPNVIHQFHSQDDAGAYEFGYSGGPSSQHEFRDHFGNVHGAYNYIDPEGKVQSRKYVSDARGFRVVGTDFPVAPEVPVVPSLNAPNPVDYTPEVKQARADFQRTYDAAVADSAASEVSGNLDGEHTNFDGISNQRKKRSADPAFAYQSTYGNTPFVYSGFPSVFRTAGVQPAQDSAAAPVQYSNSPLQYSVAVPTPTVFNSLDGSAPTPTVYTSPDGTPVQYAAQPQFFVYPTVNHNQPFTFAPASPFFAPFNRGVSFRAPQSTVVTNVDHNPGFSQNTVTMF